MANGKRARQIIPSSLGSGAGGGVGPYPTPLPPPIIATYAPTTGDMGDVNAGQFWFNTTAGSVYALVKTSAGVATWNLLESGGGAGTFASLVVTPGPTSITGTTGITGATTVTGTFTQVGTTNINHTGTAATNIGNATGNTAVTGTLGVTGVTTVASGVTPASAGSIIEILGGGGSAPSIVISAGVPTVTTGINKGSLAINNAATTATTRLYIFDGSAWQAFTAAG